MHQAFNALQIVVKGADLAFQIASSGNIIAHAASWVIHACVEASRRAYVQYRYVKSSKAMPALTLYRTNQYIDEMNETYFSKHGVYALIMCYKPSADHYEPSDSVNKAVSARADGHGGKFSRASGKTRSELELSDSAPLVFPELDAQDDVQKKNGVKKFGNFLGEYYDHRAQAVFVSDALTWSGTVVAGLIKCFLSRAKQSKLQAKHGTKAQFPFPIRRSHWTGCQRWHHRSGVWRQGHKSQVQEKRAEDTAEN